MAKSNRKKFGHCNGPIKAHKVLVKEMPHFLNQDIEAVAVLAFNEDTGTYTSANIYSEVGKPLTDGGNLGKNYNPEIMTHPIPAEGDAKWKEWTKKGYYEGNIENYDVLELAGEKVEA